MLSGRPLVTSVDRKYLVERDELPMIGRFVNAGMNTLLLGERRTGRTTMLRAIEARLREDDAYRTVYVNGARVVDTLGVLTMIRDALIAPRSAVAEGFGHVAAGSAQRPSEERGEAALALVRELTRREAPMPACVLLDDPSTKTAHELFGRLRDDIWQTEIVWVVTGRPGLRAEYLTPPADAFFDRVLPLAPLDDAQQRSLIELRLEPADDPLLAELRHASGSPGALLRALQDGATAADASGLLKRRSDREERAAKLGRVASMMHAEIENGATASASDSEWVKRFAVSRQRAQQVLVELEQQGLVTSSRAPGPTGQPRKVYHRVEDGA